MAPAETTITGVRASSSRSAEMSKLFSAPLWTPPMPPVANTLMPASAGHDHGRGDRRAAGAPLARPRRRGRRATASWRPTPAPARRARVALSPTFSRPSTTAIVAGTAPSSRMICSTAAAISAFCGKGMPCVMIVLSSATTGRPSASALATGSAMSMKGRAASRRSWSRSPHATACGSGTRASASASAALGDVGTAFGAGDGQHRGGDAFAQRSPSGWPCIIAATVTPASASPAPVDVGHRLQARAA